MQTDRSVDPMGRPNNPQEEKIPFAPLASSSHTPNTSGGIASSSVWIDPVVQRNISATSFTYEKKHGVFPHESTTSSPTSPMPPAIPRRASAHPASVVKVRPRYTRSIFVPEDSDVTRIPTLPQPTPVGLGQTPTPTVPTPTVGITPTPTQSVPTPGITPTATSSPAPATPAPTASVKPTATTSPHDIATTSQTVALNGLAASAAGPQSSSVWLWLMSVGYGLSLALLGVAGVLYLRRRAY